MTLTRRDFLAALSALAGGAERALAAQSTPAGGRFLRNMPLGRFDGKPSPPTGRMLETGLDARQFTDLSAIDPDALITPSDKFFVRTAASLSHRRASWAVDLGGLARRPARVGIDDLAAVAQPMGTHVMECSGNSNPANFGLLSAAQWTGVPMPALLDRVEPQAADLRVLVTGLDDLGNSRSSVAGASWIFSRADLERAGAFLATGMNGSPLLPDHGAPVRLVVPNWYGCACIKWVTSIDLVAGGAPATTQMREFSARTHQNGVPPLARDYAPAMVELAATPIRVEQWAATDNRPFYRIVGIRWGGSTPARRLNIRFKHSEPFVAVESVLPAESATTWSLWTHTWRPTAPGRYQIALAPGDRIVPARRLDVFYYTREVEIDRV